VKLNYSKIRVKQKIFSSEYTEKGEEGKM